LWEIYRGEPDFATGSLQPGDKVLIVSLERRMEWGFGEIGNNPDYLKYPHYVHYSKYGLAGSCTEILFRQIAKIVEW
jgi:hypothetical protein